MKVDKLKVEEGIMSIAGKRRMCPYSTNQAGQNLCGEWCALFTYERPTNDKVTVYLSCCNVTYGSM